VKSIQWESSVLARGKLLASTGATASQLIWVAAALQRAGALGEGLFAVDVATRRRCGFDHRHSLRH